MKNLTKLALAAVILCSAFAAQAEMVSGHFRNNGTYVAPYYRTPANGTPYDNLSYRGYPFTAVKGSNDPLIDWPLNNWPSVKPCWRKCK